MARALVPKKYIQSYGTLLEDFDDTGFTATTTDGNGSMVEQDVEHFIAGTGAVKVIQPSNETRVNVKKVVSWDLSDAKSFVLWLYVSPGNTSDAKVILIFETTTGVDTYRYTMSSSEIFANGWYAMTVAKADFVSAGSPDWSNINNLWIKCENAAGGDSDYTLWLDSLYKNVRTRPKVIVSFDDATESDKTEAFDYMNPLGVVGSSAIVSDFIGDANRLSVANLQTMYDAGWEICNHSSDHQRPVDVGNDAGYIENLKTCRDFINSNGWKGSADIVVYPGCSTSASVITLMQQAGFRFGRRCDSQTRDLIPTASHPLDETLPASNILAVVGYYHLPSGGSTAATAKAYADKLIETGSCGFIFMHQIVASGATGTQTNRAEFREIIDYLKVLQDQGQIDVITFKQYLEGL